MTLSEANPEVQRVNVLPSLKQYDLNDGHLIATREPSVVVEVLTIANLIWKSSQGFYLNKL